MRGRVAAGATLVGGGSIMARAVIGVVVALSATGPLEVRGVIATTIAATARTAIVPPPSASRLSVRAAARVVDVDPRRSEFGRVPPRAFVRWKGTWLHEDEIVQLARVPLAAGAPWGARIATLPTWINPRR